MHKKILIALLIVCIIAYICTSSHKDNSTVINGLTIIPTDNYMEFLENPNNNGIILSFSGNLTDYDPKIHQVIADAVKRKITVRELIDEIKKFNFTPLEELKDSTKLDTTVSQIVEVIRSPIENISFGIILGIYPSDVNVKGVVGKVYIPESSIPENCKIPPGLHIAYTSKFRQDIGNINTIEDCTNEFKKSQDNTLMVFDTNNNRCGISNDKLKCEFARDDHHHA